MSPADARTRRSVASISISRGSPAAVTWVPSVSAIRLNEWPLPSARTRSLPATTACNSSIDVGRASDRALNTMFPAQFVPVMQQRL